MTRFHLIVAIALAVQPLCLQSVAEEQRAGSTAQTTAEALAAMDTWILCQPKVVEPLPGATFDLKACKEIVARADAARDLAQHAGERLAAATGTTLAVVTTQPQRPAVSLVLANDPAEFPAAAKLDAAAFEQMGKQGYVLLIDADGVTLAAREPAGLRHAITTLSQIATDRAALPGMLIRDWPSLEYRGAAQDISRGQVPTTQTFKQLAGVLAEAKMNVLELYLEHVFHYAAYPDVSPPEGITPDEAKDMSAHAASAGVEVHPLLQALGHSFQILSKPQYQHLRIGPSEKQPWIMTFDIRKPEAVQMVTTMIDELCDAFPGKLFSVDITEIDIEELEAQGVTLDQATDLVFGYVQQLNEAVKKHNRRLMITQGPLDSRGHLSGMGPKLDVFPKDVIVGSYYCAGGPYQPAYEKDFPRLHDAGIDFFAQPWIYSHLWITPWVTRAAEFSDLEVQRGLQYGAIGSTTSDWGDIGHFHFVGEEWLPYLYHGACAWTGAQMDKDYFRKAYARVMHGLEDDAVIRAMEVASDVNAMTVKVRDKDGQEVDVSTTFMWEFVQDPFTHPDIMRIVDPAGVGQKLLDATSPALETLTAQAAKARRNKDNLEQWIFGVRCYAALGRKLVALGHYNDSTVLRKQAADELESIASEYETLQTDFKRLWLAENRENDGYQELVKRFSFTIAPYREKAKELRSAG